MKPDQERVRGLLTDTVTLLCRNGLQYSKELRVQGLLGITLDNDDVFVVHINEVFDELVGGKVAGLVSAEMDNAAAGSDTTSEPTERSESVSKPRKGVPQKHGIQRTSSPMLQGSSKRKATFRNMSPLMRVKKEEVDDDLVIVDSKGNDGATDLIPGMSELSSDGDREAMRMSYGGANDDGGEGPPSAKRRADHSKAAESFTETNTASGTPFITGMMRNSTENDTDHGTADDLGNASLDGSQLSNIGPLQDGQVLFDGSGQGCSAWDETQKQNNLQDQNAVSQDSRMKLPLKEPVGAVWFSNVVAASKLQQGSPTMVPLPERSWNMNGSWVGQPYRRRAHNRRDSRCPDKPFRCQYPNCDKTFYRKPERNRHQKIKHGCIYSPEQATEQGSGMVDDNHTEDHNANHVGLGAGKTWPVGEPHGDLKAVRDNPLIDDSTPVTSPAKELSREACPSDN